MTTTDIQPPWDNGAHRQGDRFGVPYSRNGDDHRGYDRGYGRPSFLRRTEAWLDDRGKGAWIALMVLAFVFVWPVGLALLAYMIWSKRMFGQSCNRGWSRDDARARWADHGDRRAQFHAARAAMRPSGNSAFDAYKTDTLRRLEDEQRAFEDFLSRLRNAKDKAEFDDFMADRARRPATSPATPDDDAMPEPSAK